MFFNERNKHENCFGLPSGVTRIGSSLNMQERWFPAHGNPYLKLLPEFHVAFFISFWDGHVVVFALFLVEQLVPSRTGEGRVRASEWLFSFSLCSGCWIDASADLQICRFTARAHRRMGGYSQPAPGFSQPPGIWQHTLSHGLASLPSTGWHLHQL